MPSDQWFFFGPLPGLAGLVTKAPATELMVVDVTVEVLVLVELLLLDVLLLLVDDALVVVTVALVDVTVLLDVEVVVVGNVLDVVVDAGSVVVVVATPHSAQQLPLLRTVPPAAAQAAAERLTSQRVPSGQSTKLPHAEPEFSHCPVFVLHVPNSGMSQATEPSLPHADWAAQLTIAPRH